MACWDVVVWDFHPQVLMLREFLGYRDSAEVEDEDDEEENNRVIKTLDPRNWKDQDHYYVLGLHKLRHRATDEQIKRAYRKKVLAHHPDKRRARGENVEDESHDYYSCITKAFEILNNNTKRLSYDSIDPCNDDSIPTVEEGQAEFYHTFRPIFRSNARWSKKQPVPDLGYEATPYEKVEEFYNFWYNFDSWREFSYLDKEDKDKGENRDERRYIEKLNKLERQERKKEENKRIRTLVETAHTCDPRIAAHEKKIKEEKEAKKKAKQNEIKRRKEEEEKRIREENERQKRIREEEERQKKEEQEQQKKEKEALKNRMKKEKRLLRQTFEKFGYFDNGSHDTRIKHMQQLDLLLNKLTLEEISEFNDMAKSNNENEIRHAFDDKMRLLEKKLEEERASLLTTSSTSDADKDKLEDKKWSYELTQCLIKAVNQFPPGTNKRWDAIADYINLHITGSNITGKDVLKKAKSLKKNDQSLKQEANTQAFSVFSNQVSQADACKNVTITDSSEALASRAWTADEQKRLEEALRKYPANIGPERWDKISDALGTRTRKECMLRYKELAEMIKAKKAAASK